MQASSVAEDQADDLSVVPEWVVFACGAHHFGVPIKHVREILPPMSFTRLPGAGAAVCGLIGLRGRVVTVLDFGAAVGLARAVDNADYRIVLMDREDRLAGLAVERVVGVAGGGLDDLAARADDLRALGAAPEDLLGVGELDGQPFTVVDVERVLGRLLTQPSG